MEQKAIWVLPYTFITWRQSTRVQVREEERESMKGKKTFSYPNTLGYCFTILLWFQGNLKRTDHHVLYKPSFAALQKGHMQTMPTTFTFTARVLINLHKMAIKPKIF